ncbi:MAG TPA: hypothetical protein VMF67_05635 [Rhizomicrobium sp.]|nr:hypothetical protein [Rhizomicrobium sp.]
MIPALETPVAPDLLQQLDTIHKEIADKLLSTGDVTASELAPLEQEAAKYQQEIDQDMLSMALAVRDLLAADQIKQLAQVHSQLKNLHSQIDDLMGPDQGPAWGDQPN